MTDAVEDYLEKCAQIKVKIDLVESLLRPENLVVSSRCVLKHANYGGSNVFQLFRNSRKAVSPCCKQKTMDGKSGERRCLAGGRNEWYDLGYQGAKAKAPPCPNNTLQTPLPQREERRRRRIAFENLAKGMLRYLDNCNEVKVGITELQERVEVPAQIGISIRRVAQQAVNEDGQNIFRSVLARRRGIICC